LGAAAVNFFKDYEATISLQEVGESPGEHDERNVADLLVEQVEFLSFFHSI